MSHLTTHILDATAGVPATGVAVTLAGPDGVAVASGQTDADGRLALGTWQSICLVDLNLDNPHRQVRLSFLAG